MSSESSSSKPKVAVIGAGASGLAAIKECREAGLDVVCFEAEPHVGGLWRYVPSKDPSTGEDAHSSVYQSAVMNSSKEMMSFSDFPVPKDWPTFLPHRFVAKYLNMYCDNFSLRKHIKFNRNVVSVSPEVDASGRQTGRWEVVTQKCRRRQAPLASGSARSFSPAGRGGLRAQSPASPHIDLRRNMSPVRTSGSDTNLFNITSQRGLNATASSPYRTDQNRQPSVGRTLSPERNRGRSPAPFDDEATPLMTTPPTYGYDYLPSSPVLRSASLPHSSPLDIPALNIAAAVTGSPGSVNDGFGGMVGSSTAIIRSKAESFDFVIVATGHHWKPRLPDFPGQEKFKGGLVHSHSYRVPYPYKDSRVLIVGVGNSGMDLAAELSYHARQVMIASRSGTWVLPRFTLFGLPTDHLSSRAASALPHSIKNFAVESLMRIQSGSLEKFGLKPGNNLLDAHPTINSEVLERIGAGKIIVRPNIARFAGPNTVEFEDGTVEDADHVIYCTGYRIEHPFLDSRGILGQEPEPATPTTTKPSSPSLSRSSVDSFASGNSNRVRLYKNIFPINHRNIAFVGLAQPTGAIMPVAEMQSRYVARIFTNQGAPLPSPQAMSEAVDQALKDSHFTQRDRHTIQVDYVAYMDELAELVGCRPDLWKLWRHQWLLAAQVTFGPTVPFQFRLEGPGKWDGAEAAIGDACAGYDFRKMVGYQAVAKLRDDQSGEPGSIEQ